MGPMRTTEQDALLHRAPLRAVFTAGAMDQYDVYSEINNVLSVGNSEYSMIRYDTKFAPVPRVDGDLTPTPVTDFSESPPYTVHQVNYRLTYGYTRRSEYYDKYDRIASKASALGESMIHTMNVVGSLASSQAENTGVTWGWAGEALGANAHTLIGSVATYDNLFAAAAPGQSLYDDLLAYGSAIPDEQGFKTRAEIESIEVGSVAYENEWRQFFGSPTEIGQDNPSVINSRTMGRPTPRIIFNPYMGSSTRQIVRFKGHQQNLEVARQPMFESWAENDPAGVKHRVEFDVAQGIGDMRHIVVVAAA